MKKSRARLRYYHRIDWDSFADRMRQYADQGLTAEEAALKLRIHRHTLHKNARRLGIKFEKKGTAAFAKHLEPENRAWITKAARASNVTAYELAIAILNDQIGEIRGT